MRSRKKAASRIVVINGDWGEGHLMAAQLCGEGFAAMLAADVDRGIEYALRMQAQLLLVNLPGSGITSLELCQRINRYELRIPMVFLCESADEFEQVLLLEMGADDCVVKPYGTRELAARIRSILRRHGMAPGVMLSFGEIQVDPEGRRVSRRGSDIPMTPVEFSLLTFLMRNNNRTVTRERILYSVWGHQELLPTRTLDVHIARLRRKLALQASQPPCLMTIHGVGYRFVA